MKKLVFTPTQLRAHDALANLTGVTRDDVTDAHANAHSYNESGHSGIYARLQPVLAMYEAEREGRDFTPIYWYRTDDGVRHLTLWDMNKPTNTARTVAWSKANSPTEW
jgi:hypothetical protein